jgi:ribonucleoside-diphosphate reductase alpha chain
LPVVEGFEDMSAFAATITRNKYAHELGGGQGYNGNGSNGRAKENWAQIAERVVTNVVAPYLPDLVAPIRRLVEQRKFMPGGRYLYAAGRKYHQCNNCLSGDTKIITRGGVFTLAELAGQSVEVLNRFGMWERAEVRSFGVQRLYNVRFKNGDVVAATAGHRWWQADGTRVTTPELDRVPLTLPAEFPQIDEEGLRHGIVFGDGNLTNSGRYAEVPFCTAEKEALVNHFADEERAVTVGGGATLRLRTVRRKKSGLGVHLLPAHYKTLPDPRTCTPEYARGFIAGLIATDGSTKTSTVTICQNNQQVAETIRDLAVLGGCVVCGVSLQKPSPNEIKGRPVIGQDDTFVIRIKPFSAPVVRPDQVRELAARRLAPRKMWLEVDSVEDSGRVEEVYCCVVPGSESFTLSNGLITSNCFLFKAEDSKEGWGTLAHDTCLSLMTGGGIGVVYNDIREEGARIAGLGGTCTGPCSLMKLINEQGRYVMQGGSRRSAIWAGLIWTHRDIFKFISIKDWTDEVKQCKLSDFNFPAPMDGTNVSVILDDDFFEAYSDPTHPLHSHACNVYWSTVRHMLRHGEPGFSVDVGESAGENLRNACTEVTSRDNRDMCNLGSANLARITSPAEFAHVVEMGTAFLLCGTLYSKLPVPEMYAVRERNRRLGLGLMGVHEWLIKRGRKYGPDEELGEWLKAYQMSGSFAHRYADKLGVSRPVATRSIAPNGTISIVAETTSAAEPMFAVAEKRRYLDGQTWKYQYKVDATAHRLIQSGVPPEAIEDAYTLAEDVDRRLEFQAWIQSYVDHGISSTINLPPWGSSTNNEGTVTQFGTKLLKYLPRFRGITAYPDGSRGGQPLTKVSYHEAVKHLGVEFVETGDRSCTTEACGG